MNTTKVIEKVLSYITEEDQEKKSILLDELRAIQAESPQTSPQKNAEYVVREIFTKIGLPDHVLGSGYAVHATKLAIEKPDIIHAITKELYPMVAKEFGTTPSRAERAIRHAIEMTFDRITEDAREEFFGDTIHAGKGKATNAEFIARIANVARQHLAQEE